MYTFKCMAVLLCSNPSPVKPSMQYKVKHEAIVIIMILMLK